MHPFDHFTPQSIPEALNLLARMDGQARVIAGGTDLMLQMKANIATPATVINIKRLPELRGLTYNDKVGLQLGALTTLRELTRSPLIQQHYPCLAQAAGLMAGEQIRSFATMGGNLCNASPSADLAPPLIALGATAHIVGSQGERQLPLEEFFLGPGMSALAHGELLRAISVPLPVGKMVYIKHSPRAFMDIAVVGVAVWLQLSDEIRAVRVVLGAVAPVPMRAHAAEDALVGELLTSERISRAAQIAAEVCSPIDDVRGSAWYRRRMVAVLTRRALRTFMTTDQV